MKPETELYRFRKYALTEVNTFSFAIALDTDGYAPLFLEEKDKSEFPPFSKIVSATNASSNNYTKHKNKSTEQTGLNWLS